MSQINFRSRRPASFVCSAVALGLLTGCASVTPIGDLLNNSSRYNGKTVRIEGEVRESAGALGVGAYQVRDATGTLPIVSAVAAPPRTGSKIRVKGKFESLFTFGSRGLAVMHEESRSVP